MCRAVPCPCLVLPSPLALLCAVCHVLCCAVLCCAELVLRFALMSKLVSDLNRPELERWKKEYYQLQVTGKLSTSTPHPLHCRRSSSDIHLLCCVCGCVSDPETSRHMTEQMQLIYSKKGIKRGIGL
jgi:hypothetical protein